MFAQLLEWDDGRIIIIIVFIIDNNHKDFYQLIKNVASIKNPTKNN